MSWFLLAPKRRSGTCSCSLWPWTSRAEWSTIGEPWLTLRRECSLNITHTWRLIICSCARLKLLQTIQSFFNLCFCHRLATVWHKVVLFGYADENLQCCIFIGHCRGMNKAKIRIGNKDFSRCWFIAKKVHGVRFAQWRFFGQFLFKGIRFQDIIELKCSFVH